MAMEVRRANSVGLGGGEEDKGSVSGDSNVLNLARDDGYTTISYVNNHLPVQPRLHISLYVNRISIQKTQTITSPRDPLARPLFQGGSPKGRAATLLTSGTMSQRSSLLGGSSSSRVTVQTRKGQELLTQHFGQTTQLI